MWNRTHLIALIGLALLASSCAGVRNTDTTPTARVKVDAHVGKALSSDGTRIETITDDFMAGETVFAVVDVPGRMDGQMQVKWMREGTQVHEQTVNLTDQHAYSFQLDPPSGGNAVGEYELDVYVNGERVESEHFKVKAA